jgi:hypothetical protein
MIRPGFVLAALCASPALAQPRPLTTAMPCSAAQALVRSDAPILLSTGANTYDRFVAHLGQCSADQTTEPAFEQTADAPQCFIGYRCVSRFKDTPDIVK